MISEELQKKIQHSIKILQVSCGDETVEISYSGGKDSDVILQLAKEAGIKYRAIYKNTTIDPKGTVKHVKDMGVEILMPKNGMTFFKLIEHSGLPSRTRRFCCKELKEYKVLDKAVHGIRTSESKKRADRYKEPTMCRFYGNKKNHVEVILPILDWTDQDVEDFILDRNITCAPTYYDENGIFHVERRLGCMCCPLQSKNKRIQAFKDHPNMLKAYARAAQLFLNQHKNGRTAALYKNAYEWLYRDIFMESTPQWNEFYFNLFGTPDCKQLLEDFFNIKFNDNTMPPIKE